MHKLKHICIVSKCNASCDGSGSTDLPTNRATVPPTGHTIATRSPSLTKNKSKNYKQAAERTFVARFVYRTIAHQH